MTGRACPLEDREIVQYYLSKFHATDKDFFHEQARESNESSCIVCGLVFTEAGQKC